MKLPQFAKAGSLRRFQAKQSSWSALVLSCALFLGLGTAVSLGAERPQIQFDPSPLPQELKAETSYAPVVKKVAPSVVNIYSTRQQQRGMMNHPFFNDPLFRRFFGAPEGLEEMPQQRLQQSLGSGVIVTRNGYLLTNNHVVEGADEIRVSMADGREYTAEVVGTDPATDLAVLKIDANDLPSVVIGDSANLEVGDTVLAIGNPFGVGQTVTSGIVSGTGRTGFGIVDYEDFIQTDASINPGNSGGALTDVLGRLVGVNTAIISGTGGSQGIGFAVPSNMARHIMQQIIDHGRVVRGQLGIYIQPLTRELAKAFHLEQDKGALVAGVNPNSPAERAGLKEGDIIVAYNGDQVDDSHELRMKVAQTPPGTRVNLVVLRDGRERKLTARLEELPSEQLAQGRTGAEPQFGTRSGLEGVEFGNLNREIIRQLNVPSGVDGALITRVEPGSPAHRAGLREGDIVLEVNREPVGNAREAVSAISDTERDSVLLRIWSRGGSRYVVINRDRESERQQPQRRR